MEEVTPGQRQRREVNAYNLFHSAISARASPSLYSHGVRIPMMFPVIRDRPRDIRAEPDFVLYDGNTCALVEIKSGNNIEEDHIDQMEMCAGVSIEKAQETLKAAQVRERIGYSGDVETVEPIIVYHDLNGEYIREASNESEQFRRRLSGITEHAVLMTQDYGEELRLLAGEFGSSGSLQSALESGITLPKNPPDTIPLTENMEPEILAIAITDIWGEKAIDHEDGYTVTRPEVRDYFAPQHNVNLGDVDHVFKFLEEFGACKRVGGHKWEFGREHYDAILRVESQVMEETVQEYLHDEDQTSLEDHMK